MDRKSIMVVAAVAGIGFLLYLRKKGDGEAIGSAASLAAAASNWATQPIVINTSTKPNQVVDTVASSPRPPSPPPPPPPAAYGDFAIGGSVPGTAPAATTGQMSADDWAEYQRRLGLR